MPLYIGDFQLATQRLTTEQQGAYLRLLMDYWRNGPPPLDDGILQAITGLSRSAWRKNKPILLSLFTIEDRHLHQDALESLRAKAIAKMVANSARAKTAALVRWRR